jgi:hypothetical protein
MGPHWRSFGSRSVRVNGGTRQQDVRNPAGSPLDLKSRLGNFGGDLDPFRTIVCMLSMRHKMAVIEAELGQPDGNGESKAKRLNQLHTF